MISKLKTVPHLVGSVASSLVWMINPASAGILDRLFSPAQRTAVPFEAGRKGAVATTNYHATRDGSFYFYLNLKFDPSLPATRAKVQEVAGTGATRDGVRINNGVPIPVRLIVRRLDGAANAVVLDKRFQEEELEGYGAESFAKIISAVALKKGDYQVEIEALNDIPQIDGIPIDLDIHVPGNVK